MRKFRVWNEKEQKYETCSTLISDEGNVVELCNSELNLGESLVADFSIGKSDSKNREIFENDVIAISGFSEVQYGIVKYNSDICAYVMEIVPKNPSTSQKILKMFKKVESYNDGKSIVSFQLSYTVIGDIRNCASFLEFYQSSN